MQKLLLDNGIKWDLICLNIMTVSECGAKGEKLLLLQSSLTHFLFSDSSNYFFLVYSHRP